MLYKFKSKNAGDVIMLEPNGRRILEVIGKDAGPKGIVLPGEMLAAIAALQAEIAAEEKALKEADAEPLEGPGLRQRAMPFIDLLQRSQRSGDEVVWGV
ncbi:MAG: DUF1840 domain-containing protein [Polaromonas sp.]|nr:DUF1840 domain-containing protein [Polaromonas sp.]